MINRLIAFLFCFLCVQSNLFASELTSLLVRKQDKMTAVLCVFSGQFTYRAFILPTPNRLVLDLSQTSGHLNWSRIVLDKTNIIRLRTGHPTPQSLRLVFDLKQSMTFKTSVWQPANKNLRGLRIDLVPFGLKNASQVSKPAHINEKKIVHAPHQSVVHKPSGSLRDVVVVIDPGHGGKDPGAIGQKRTAEKQVVLAIALKLKQLIDRQPGMRAVLTRTGDYYIGLRERMYIARKDDADIFVAIHADAFNNPNSNGASVFALSAKGATSEAARWLAEKENYSELGGVNLKGLDDRNGVIRTVLIDLSQTATIEASLQMGSRVLRHLDTITRLHNAKVEQARFMVLKSPDIPSILIETGFISNPKEESNLTSPIYQARLTHAIFNGIKAYFWAYPPHGTRVEAMAGSSFTKPSFHTSVS